LKGGSTPEPYKDFLSINEEKRLLVKPTRAINKENLCLVKPPGLFLQTGEQKGRRGEGSV